MKNKTIQKCDRENFLWNKEFNLQVEMAYDVIKGNGY